MTTTIHRADTELVVELAQRVAALEAQVAELRAERRPDPEAEYLLDELARAMTGTFTATDAAEAPDADLHVALAAHFDDAWDDEDQRPTILGQFLKTHRGRCVAGGVLVRLGRCARGRIWRFE